MSPTSPASPGRPEWLDLLTERAADATELVPRFPLPAEGARRSAVLMLFGPDGRGGVDVVLTERAADLRSHPGQVSFPGGREEPQDDGPAATALREAAEEVGLHPDTVEVLASFPGLYLPPSNSAVVPVLAWWRDPHEIGVADPREVARVERVPVEQLLDPARRFTVAHPSGYVGGAFDAGGLFVWGFTAMILDGLLELAGLAVPWDREVSRPLPDRYERLHRAATGRGWDTDFTSKGDDASRRGTG